MNDEVEQAFRQGLMQALQPASLKAIADHYGFTSQADMLTEEAAEFTQAVNKLRRGFPDAYKNIKEEVADVLVVALQLRYLLGGDEIDKIMRNKTKRQIENEDGEKPIKNLGEKLKPCPFCGRKMIFYEETYKNMHGRQCTRRYYMHEDYDINQEESCILDDIDMPFTIGAGDARPDTGYIGEYGEKWNTRVAPHLNANTETCVCCGAEIPEGRQVCPACENGEDK